MLKRTGFICQLIGEKFRGSIEGFALSCIEGFGVQPAPCSGAPGTVLKLRHYRGKNGFVPLTREEADPLRCEVLGDFPADGIACRNRDGMAVQVFRSGVDCGLGALAYERDGHPLGALVTYANGRGMFTRTISAEEANDLEKA